MSRRSHKSLVEQCCLQTLESRLLLTSFHGDDHRPPPESSPDYVLWPKWAQPGGTGSPLQLTYSYSNLLNGGMPGGLTANQLRDGIEEGFQLWSAVVPLQFVERADSGPITINDNPYPASTHPLIRLGHHFYDGPFNVLAHAYSPGPDGRDGDIHFDNGDTWALTPSGPIDLIEVATHEIGHAIGLDHEPTPPAGNNAIMNPFYGGRFSGPGSGFLLQDDINGIQAQYGAGLGYVFDQTGTLYVSGTQAANNMNVSFAGTTLTVSSTFGSFTRNMSAVNAVVINARGGNDIITISSFPSGASLFVSGGAGDDSITVNTLDAGSGATIDAGAGIDQIRLGLGNSLSGIARSVAINGDFNDDVFLQDSATTANQTYTLTNAAVVRAGFGGIAYGGLRSLQLDAGSGHDTIFVQSSVAGTSMIVNAGGGDDQVALGTGNLDTLPGNVTVNGQAGAFDSLFLVDDANSSTDTYTITSTTVDRIVFGLLTYSNMHALSLDAQQGSNVINVNSTFNGTLRIDANGGADTVNVVSNFGGTTVVVDGGPALDTVNVNTDAIGTAAVRFDLSQDLASLTIGAGGTVTLGAGGTRVLRTSSLSTSGSAKLDLTDNSMILDYSGTSPLTSIRTALATGYAGGAWNGNGINSSTAAATANRALGYAESSAIFTSFPATFAGQLVDSTAVLVRYARYGDANLDQTVNLADYNRLSANYGAGTLWSQGNFNYDSTVNLADYNRLSANYGQPLAASGYGGGTTTFRDGKSLDELLAGLFDSET